ncbi:MULTISPECIES: RagB/SusD family nutrient uptake outer membrane protein [unclassified Arenibacter]|uniref:RagB/SusD family nutrient uptake outer membrane protein n=1 Tax=unclassified Arenibacter TaxID=2615047 RepID=UPI000E354FA2|nr:MULTISPECIES: RagB/SusD family nutrient uptake outer membrane protein [unclassified Arenibacter]MCM4162663.1 RagB/SusD family nutrient uptake outer membrane protein [Arenibacter sp. A80]RFT58228.1 RagB/SusD family nutrient uptake outer membrane protein [Arenibacter sp. P308M17]
MKLKLKFKYALVLIFIFFGVGFQSCDSEYLEGQPLNAISEANVWVDLALVESFVNQTYGTLRAGYYANTRMVTMTDDGYGIEKNSAQLVQRGEVTPSNMGLLGAMWSEYYTTISNCNKFLSNVQGDNLEILMQQDEVRTNRMIGEIKFFRAYSYFRLIAFFGGVPLITEPFILGDDYLLPRNQYDEILEFILNEFDEAAELLPPSFDAKNKGRVTSGAALAIKSRALLYAASPWHNPGNEKVKWQRAADAAKAVIDLGRYSLYPDYKESFMEKGNFNQERIWEYVLNQQMLYSGEYRVERKMFPNGSRGWSQPSPTQNFVDCYETTNGLLPDNDPSFDPNYPYTNRDPRFYATVLYDGAPFQGREIEVFPGGIDSPDGNEGWNATWTGYNINKFIDESILSPTNTNSSNPNWVFCRYGEILLNYAEAQYYLGNEEVAREYLNMIRDRPSVSMPHILDSGVELEKRIRNERRIELFAEEHRFFDLRRWKITADSNLYRVNVTKNATTGVKSYTYTPFQSFILPEKMHLSPIPFDEINRDPLLEQNPGY